MKEIALILAMLFNEVIYIYIIISDLNKLSRNNTSRIEKNKLILSATCSSVLLLATTCWLILSCYNYFNGKNVIKSVSTIITLVIYIIVKFVNYIVDKTYNDSN